MEGRDKHVCATPTSTAACLALGVNFLPMLLDLNSSLSFLSRLPTSQECQSHISQPLGLHLLFLSLLPLALHVSPGSLLSHPALCLPRLPTHTHLMSRYSNCLRIIFPTMTFLSLLRQDVVLFASSSSPVSAQVPYTLVITPMETGRERWGGSAWGRERSGETLEHLPILKEDLRKRGRAIFYKCR